MAARVRFHHLFERFIPLPPPQRGAPRIFSLKLERTEIAAAPKDFVDVVLANERWAYGLPFIAVDGGEAIFPAAAARLGEPLLATLRGTIETWLASKALGSLEIDLFGRDAALERAVADESAGAALVPGLATHARLFAAIDRYARALPYCNGRSVLDLNPLCGYGTRLFAQRAAQVDAIVPDAELRALAERFGYIAPLATAPDRRYDVVAAFDIPPAGVPASAAAARSALAAGGALWLSARGPEGERALRAAGLATFERWPANTEAPDLATGDYLGTIATAPAPAARNSERAPAAVAERPLRIMFALRPSGQKHSGGDVVQAQRTAESLRRRGHQVALSFERELDAAGMDVVHLTNITTPEDTLPQVRSLDGFAGAIVLTPIFLDLADEMMWGSFASVVSFRDYLAQDDLDRVLQSVAQRRIRADGCEAPPARTFPNPRYEGEQKELLGLVDYVLVNAATEAFWIHRHLDASVPFAVVPTCVEAGRYTPAARERFVAKYGIADFVLSTARLDARKNHLMLAHALRRRPEAQLVMVGRGMLPNYGSLLTALLPANVWQLPELSEDDLAGAYAACKVFIQPSWCEVVSLSALNAAACEASLVLSRNSAEHEVFGDDAEYCDPGSVDSIVAALDRALASHGERAARRTALRARLMRAFTWETAAAASEAAYYRVLANNPRGERRLRALRAR